MGRLLAENERKNPDMIRIRKTLNPSSKDSIHNLNQNENTKASKKEQSKASRTKTPKRRGPRT